MQYRLASNPHVEAAVEILKCSKRARFNFVRTVTSVFSTVAPLSLFETTNLSVIDWNPERMRAAGRRRRLQQITYCLYMNA